MTFKDKIIFSSAVLGSVIASYLFQGCSKPVEEKLDIKPRKELANYSAYELSRQADSLYNLIVNPEAMNPKYSESDMNKFAQVSNGLQFSAYDAKNNRPKSDNLQSINEMAQDKFLKLENIELKMVAHDAPAGESWTFLEYDIANNELYGFKAKMGPVSTDNLGLQKARKIEVEIYKFDPIAKGFTQIGKREAEYMSTLESYVSDLLIK